MATFSLVTHPGRSESDLDGVLCIRREALEEDGEVGVVPRKGRRVHLRPIALHIKLGPVSDGRHQSRREVGELVGDVVVQLQSMGIDDIEGELLRRVGFHYKDNVNMCQKWLSMREEEWLDRDSRGRTKGNKTMYSTT